MNSRQRLTFQSGSRLHFGLWGWGPEYQQQFGGVGMMIATPAIQLTMTAADRFEVSGNAAERVRKTAEGCVGYWGWPELPRCRIEVVESPPQHVGLGVGTQLDLLVAKGLAKWHGDEKLGLSELALAVDRGGRSSVGTHGFQHGGLIVEAGRGPGDTVGELLHRVEVPSAWRVVLIIPQGTEGLSGANEQEAFDNLPPVPRQTHDELKRLACDELVPAASAGDFDRFARHLYDYGRLAGECYATIQHAPYHSREAVELVQRLRDAGVQGVAQSSWGPALLALTATQAAGTELAQQLRGWFPQGDQQILVAQPLNTGAQVMG